MIARDAQPIAHTPPLRRVDMRPVRTAPPTVEPIASVAEILRQAEAERIWSLVRQAAAGESAT